jgi:uncharacterized protein
MAEIPFFSPALKGWQFASQAFALESKSNLRWQRFRICGCALIYPQFASRWFEILKTPDYSLITAHRPRLYFKPFRVYLSVRWTKKQRIKVIMDTYRFIMSKGESFVQVLTNKDGIEIASFNLNETITGSIVLGYDEKHRKEGELVFFFKCDQLGGMIASGSCSFEEMKDGTWVCWIGSIQGSKKDVENSSKLSQGMMHGLRPKSLIVFAIQEFSRHLGFTAIYGAGDAIQVYRRKHAIHLPWRHKIVTDYNATWTECGSRESNDGWYELPLTPVRRNIEEIKSNKRALYRRRYSLLDDLSMKIADGVKRLEGKI